MFVKCKGRVGAGRAESKHKNSGAVLEGDLEAEVGERKDSGFGGRRLRESEPGSSAPEGRAGVASESFFGEDAAGEVAQGRGTVGTEAAEGGVPEEGAAVREQVLPVQEGTIRAADFGFAEQQGAHAVRAQFADEDLCAVQLADDAR